MLSTKFAVSERAGIPVQLGHAGQAFEHVGQPGFGIVAVALGAFDHGMDDGGMLPANRFGDFVSLLKIGP